MNNFLGDSIYHTKLENNLNIYYIEKKGFDKKYAALSTNYGSNDLIFEDSNGKVINLNYGIAHFLEHKMFEQSDGSDAFSKFAEYGASANAFTNFNMTSYIFSTTDDFYSSLKHLISYVNQPYFTDENVKKEQGIIEQEIKMYEDNADWRIFLNTLKCMYVNHPNKIDILGTVESINKITKEELYKCYETFYSPANMVLTIAGDLSWDRILEVVKEFNTERIKDKFNINKIDIDEPNYIANREIIENMSVSIPMFSLGIKDTNEKLSQLESLKRSISVDIILKIIFGKGSRIDEYLKDNNLIYDSLSYGYTSTDSYGYAIISGESRDYNKVIDEIIREIEYFKKVKIKEDDFNRIKKATIGRMVRLSDSVEFLSNALAVSHFTNLSLDSAYNIIKEITVEDINEKLVSFFDDKMFVKSIINPIGDTQNE